MILFTFSFASSTPWMPRFLQPRLLLCARETAIVYPVVRESRQVWHLKDLLIISDTQELEWFKIPPPLAKRKIMKVNLLFLTEIVTKYMLIF